MFATDLLEPLVGLAREAEAAGFHRVWTTEYRGRDAVARALAIGLATERIGVGTGIAYAFTRPPLAMADLAMDVQRLLGGRFSLGLGTGTRGVRRWYGAEFEPAATRFGEYVSELHRYWDEAAQPDWPPAPRVFGAGLNPAMLRAVARSSDGLVLHPIAAARVHLRERVLPAVRQGLEQSGRAHCRIAVWCIASIAPDEDIARSNARRQLAFYLSTPSYAPVLEGSGFEGVARDIQAAFNDARPNVRWDQLEHLIPDAMLDELALAGTESTVRQRALSLEQELLEAGAEEVVFQTVGVEMSSEATIENCRAIVRSLGPRVGVI